MELRRRCRRDACVDTKETTGCQVGLRRASTWGHASMGHASQRGFARRSCCCCLLLLLLVVAAAPGAAVARGYQHARQSTRGFRQAEAALSHRARSKSGVRHSRGKFGQSKASGEILANRMQRSNLVSPINDSTIISFPNMTNLPIFSQICLGFVISRL